MGGPLYPLSTIQLVVLTSLEASWGCPRPRPQMEHGINLSLGILCNDLLRRNFTWKKFVSMLLCPTKQRNKTLLTSLVPNHSRRVRNTLEKGGQLSPASALCKECTAGQTQDEEQLAEQWVLTHPCPHQRPSGDNTFQCLCWDYFFFWLVHIHAFLLLFLFLFVFSIIWNRDSLLIPFLSFQ